MPSVQLIRFTILTLFLISCFLLQLNFSSTIASIPLSFQKFKKIFPLPTAQTITLFQYVKRRPAGPWASDVAAAMVILACNRLSLFLRYIHHLHPDPAVPGPGAGW